MGFDHVVASFLLAVVAIALLLAGVSAITRLDRLWQAQTTKLQVALRHFKALFDSHPQAELLLNASGTIEALNRRAANSLGYAPGMLVQRRFSTLVPEPDRATLSRQLMDAARGPGQQFETLLQRAAGQREKFRIHAQPVSHNNRSLGLQLTLDPIEPCANTAPVTSPQGVDVYQRLFESGPDAMLLLDRQGRIRSVNPALCTLLGETSEHLRTVNWRDVVDPHDPRVPGMLEALSEHDHFCGEVNLLRRHGPPLPAEVSVADFHSTDDEKWSGVVLRDLSLRKDTTEQVRLLRTCISHLNDIVMITEIPGMGEKGERIVFVNRAFERITGFAAEEAIGASPRLLQGPLTDGDTLVRIRERLAQHLAVREELVSYRKSGEPFWIEMDIVPIFDDTGFNSHFVAVARDVTQRHEGAERLEENEQKYRAMFDLNPDPVYLVDLKGHIVSANRRAIALSGYSESELLGTPLSQLVSVEDHGQVFHLLSRSLKGEQETITVTGIRGNGERRVIEINASALIIAGEVKGALGIVRDITEQRRNEQDLRITTNALGHVAEAAVITDLDWHIVWVNNAFSRITGFTAREATGQALPQLGDNPQAPDFFQRIRERLLSSGHWQGEIHPTRKGGEPFPAQLSLSTVNDDNNEPSHFVCLFSDISRHKQYEQRLEFLAHNDALTGLPNRTLFEKKAAEAMARAERHGQAMGLIFIDLDQFKAINDSLGHAVGDALLQRVAERLSSVVRRTDTLVRPGGDEFIVLLEELRDSSDAALVADTLLRELTRPFSENGYELFTSASIGISCYPEDGRDVETLLRNADAAMYRAKELGRNTYAFYSAEINERAKDYLFIANSLRQAIEREELRVYYQPSVDLRSGRIVGAEALVRWQHPERGLMSPAHFIPIAESTGLIGALGDWVLETACQHAQAWEDAGYGSIPVAVNLSARQLRRIDLAATVKQILEKTRLAPWRLKLEITESMVMEQPEQASRILYALHGLGVGIAIDDFGTGYSSLSSLKQFPFDCLKIDQSFVNGIPDDDDDISIVRTILSMAKAMRLSVIAEGMETEPQRRFLQREGCPEGQGFLFSRPLPLEDFEALLAQPGDAAAFTPLFNRRTRNSSQATATS